MSKLLNNLGSGMAGNKARSVGVLETLPEEVKDIMSAKGKIDINKLGINGTNFPDCTPTYVPIKRAKVIKKYDSYITLGADAPSGPGSGYSSMGGRCSTIDMVTGRMSSVVEASTNPSLYVLDSFKNDASRIYISQRTDVDENFGIALGSVGNSRGRSAIALKSDAVRIIGREGIKLVTSPYGDYNSQSGKITTRYGIDLMAQNNDIDLQPIPKGDNLVKILEEIMVHIANLYTTIFSLSKEQAEFAIALGAHTHITGAPGSPTGPSVEIINKAIKLSKTAIEVGALTSMQERLNTALDELNYLYTLGSTYINSDLNRTN